MLLDQGVRTWGVVRLVLSAALLAFGKQAARRRAAFRIAVTSTTEIVNPLELDAESLGREAAELQQLLGVGLRRTAQGAHKPR